MQICLEFVNTNCEAQLRRFNNKIKLNVLLILNTKVNKFGLYSIHSTFKYNPTLLVDNTIKWNPSMPSAVQNDLIAIRYNFECS